MAECHDKANSDLRAILYHFNAGDWIFFGPVIAIVAIHKSSHMNNGFVARKVDVKPMSPVCVANGYGFPKLHSMITMLR